MRRILVSLNLLLVINIVSAQTNFDKISFLIGSDDYYLEQYCELYLECDCCASNVYFSRDSFLMLNWCISDISVIEGSYKLNDEVLVMSPNNNRIDIQYNWEAEVDENAQPKYFVRDTAVSMEKWVFDVSKCVGYVLKSRNSSLYGTQSKDKLNQAVSKLNSFGLDSLTSELTKRHKGLL